MTEEEFYSICDKIDKEYSDSMWFVDSDAWPGKRQAIYANGVVHGMYRENNRDLIEMLSERPDYNRIVNYLLKSQKETDSWCEKFEIDILGKNEYVRLNRLGKFYREYPILTNENILKWVNDYNAQILKDLKSEPEQRQLMFLQLYYGYYEHQKRQMERLIFCQDNIKAIYDSVFDKSTDYWKYGLIPTSDSIEFMDCNPPRVYDHRCKKTIFIWLKKPMSEVIDKLCKEGYVEKCSFRGYDNQIFDGRIEMEYLCEAIERGSIFSMNIDLLPSITKLYSIESAYEDQLWVLKDEENLTFEELCHEDEYTDKELVKTQMVHLMYKRENDKTVISHIDHEYIYYTVKEFETRRSDAHQKGSAHSRIKTFKLDDANIPFDYACEMWKVDKVTKKKMKILVPFIYFVINAYFEHSDLVGEYFEKCLN